MLIRQKNKFEKIASKLHINEIAPELFSASLIAYLLAYLFEQLLPGIVSFGISLNVLLWAMIGLGIIFVMVNRNEVEQTKLESFDLKNIKLSSYILVAAVSIVGFFIIFEKTKTIASISLAISSLSALIIFGLGILTLGESKRESDEVNRIGIWTRRTSLFLIGILVLWCTFSYLIPFGTLTYRIDPLHPSRFVTAFAFEEAQKITASLVGGKQQFYAVYQNPLLLSVQIPRFFKKADISVIYKPVSTNAPVSIGVKRAKGGMEYVLAADHQPLLESMPPQWQKVEGGEYDAWVRNKTYDKAFEDIEKQKKINEENLRKKFQQDTEKLNRQVQSEKISQDVYASARKELQVKLNSDLANNAESKSPDLENFENPYKTISDVLEKSNTPFSRIATYNVSSDKIFVAESFGSFDTTNGYNQSTIIRGSHTLIGYAAENSLLTGTITIIDSNRHEREDPVTLTITQNDELVFQKKLDDDGNQSPDNKASNERSILFKELALSKGIFHVSITTNDDVFIKSIQLSVPFAALTKSAYIADSIAYEKIFPGSAKTTILYTNSKSLTFFTSHKEGFQDIAVNKRTVKLSKADENISIDQLEGVTKIVIPKGDVKVTGDGVFSFQEKSPLFFYINTSLPSVTAPGQLSQYDVLLASYTPSDKQGEWQVAHASIDSPNLGYPDKIATIGIDFGQLGIDARKVMIKEITVTFVKDPITVSKIISKIRGFFD